MYLQVGVARIRPMTLCLKVKIRRGGQMSKFCNAYLVRAITLQVIVVSSLHLVEMLTMECRRVVCKTHGSMSKVKVTLIGPMSKLCNLCLDQVRIYCITTIYWYIFMICGRNVHTDM